VIRAALPLILIADCHGQGAKKSVSEVEAPLTLSRWGQEKTYLVARIAIGISVLKSHAIVLLIEIAIATT
jgi:hypothetical protein